MSASAISPGKRDFPVQLPNKVVLRYKPWPEEEGQEVEFRLVYRGTLPSQGGGRGGTHVKEKHEIRRQFHPQLKELWKRNHYLKNLATPVHVLNEAGESQLQNRWEFLASKFLDSGYRYLPLVNSIWGLGCSIDILFLRRDDPGGLICDGGDLDNRIKVLWDGLRMSKHQEATKFAPQEGEDPFYCLLEDDSLITDVSITTDRLLTPVGSEELIEDVHLVLHVKTKVLDEEKEHTQAK